MGKTERVHGMGLASNRACRHQAPSYTLGNMPNNGRSSFVQPTCTPGPAMYSQVRPCMVCSCP